jgi:hypothetical protein
MGANRHVGAEAMSLYILDAVLRILDIRGHIPQHGGFSAGRDDSPADTGHLMRVLAAIATGVAFVMLAVWLAHKVL